MSRTDLGYLVSDALIAVKYSGELGLDDLASILDHVSDICRDASGYYSDKSMNTNGTIIDRKAYTLNNELHYAWMALCKAIEAIEAFKEVSNETL